NAVMSLGGLLACWIGIGAAGRALRAAQRQTELTTTRVGAVSLPSAASTSAAVRSSWNPMRVNSSRIGCTSRGSYMDTFSGAMVVSLPVVYGCRTPGFAAGSHLAI